MTDYSTAERQIPVHKRGDETQYSPTDVRIRRNRAGEPTNRDEAESWVHTHGVRQAMLSDRPNYSMLLADAWLRHRDSRIVAKFLDWSGRGAPPISDRTMREARRRLAMYVIGDKERQPDPVCKASPDDGVRPWFN